MPVKRLNKFHLRDHINPATKRRRVFIYFFSSARLNQVCTTRVQRQAIDPLSINHAAVPVVGRTSTANPDICSASSRHESPSTAVLSPHRCAHRTVQTPRRHDPDRAPTGRVVWSHREAVEIFGGTARPARLDGILHIMMIFSPFSPRFSP